MPSIQNYEKKSARKKKSEEIPIKKATQKHKPRRRPGREEVTQEAHVNNHKNNEDIKNQESVEAVVEKKVKEAPVDEYQQTASADQLEREQDHMNEESGSSDRKKVHLDFYGSEILKAKAPKAFEIAESVAEEWVNDGDFKNIPIDHPLAQYIAGLGLARAKKIEKKLEEKGVFTIAKIGIEMAKSKLKSKGS